MFNLWHWTIFGNIFCLYYYIYLFHYLWLVLTEGVSTWMRGVTMTSSRALLMTVAQVSFTKNYHG